MKRELFECNLCRKTAPKAQAISELWFGSKWSYVSGYESIYVSARPDDSDFHLCGKCQKELLRIINANDSSGIEQTP
jgi:hypothetical protein